MSRNAFGFLNFVLGVFFAGICFTRFEPVFVAFAMVAAMVLAVFIPPKEGS